MSDSKVTVTLTLTLTHSLSLVRVVMMRSTDFETSRSISCSFSDSLSSLVRELVPVPGVAHHAHHHREAIFVPALHSEVRAVCFGLAFVDGCTAGLARWLAVCSQ